MMKPLSPTRVHLSRYAGWRPRFFAAVLLAASATTTLPAYAQGASMSTDTQATVIHRLYEEVLNQKRLDLLPELVSPNVISHAADNTPQTGIAAFEQTIKRTQGLFTGQHFTVDDVISSGDKAAARWTMTANNTVPINGLAPTGKQITQHAIVFYRFENGKIAETWLQLDRLGTLQQIGVQVPGAPTPPVTTAR